MELGADMQQEKALPMSFVGLYREKGCCLLHKVYEWQHAGVPVQLIIFNRQTVLYLAHQQPSGCTVLQIKPD